MKLYKATVQLNGNPENQVIKERLTAAEMKVLEFIHMGKAPALIQVEHMANVNRTDGKERVRLAQTYPFFSRGNESYTGEALVEKLFGVRGLPLPKEYEAPVYEPVQVFDEVDEDEDEEIIPVHTPVARVTETSVDALAG